MTTENWDKVAKDAEGCGDQAFKMGCALTLLTFIIGALLMFLL
jgi:hypothetical protein